MIEIKGKYNTAKVYTDEIDEVSTAQIIALCNQEFTASSAIRIMPDVHAGAGCTIGTTMTIQDRVVPNLVGVDIGCGMRVIKLADKRVNLPVLDNVIKQKVKAGFEVRETPHRNADQIRIAELRCAKACNLDRGYQSIGTLGGGNHFIELDKDDEGNLYLVIHTGSRHLGMEVAEHYQKLAYQKLSENKEGVKQLIDQYKREGRESELNQALIDYQTEAKPKISREMAYVEGEDFRDYLHDMTIMQEFATINRKTIADIILKEMKLKVVSEFETIHNYIDMQAIILRKGAVSAKDGEELIIPINMRDGSLICIGKGNAEWNASAPHGAGRLMSRSDAKRSFTVNEFKKQMNGVYSSTINASTLDECPMAYKSMEDIVKHIGETVTLVRVIKPVYNFKAGENS